jgi:hypothetical protein
MRSAARACDDTTAAAAGAPEEGAPPSSSEVDLMSFWRYDTINAPKTKKEDF